MLSERTRRPVLPRVTSLDLNACNFDQLDPKTLLIWLLLAPNTQTLNVCQGSPNAKIQLINRLKALLDADQRLKAVTDTVAEVHVFYFFESSSFALKEHICQMYSTVFRKPIIRC